MRRIPPVGLLAPPNGRPGSWIVSGSVRGKRPTDGNWVSSITQIKAFTADDRRRDALPSLTQTKSVGRSRATDRSRATGTPPEAAASSSRSSSCRHCCSRHGCHMWYQMKREIRVRQTADDHLSTDRPTTKSASTCNKKKISNYTSAAAAGAAAASPLFIVWRIKTMSGREI